MPTPRFEPDWPKAPVYWQRDAGTQCASIPFTWNLEEVRQRILADEFGFYKWVVGGPATALLPNFFCGMQNVTVQHSYPNVLQKINPMATRTTLGCVRRCEFCGIGKKLIEPQWAELADWPDKPIICDNNILAASMKHFHRVMDRLVKWNWCDFNQGLDARLLKPEHARRLAEVRDGVAHTAIARLALDNDGERPAWTKAYETLRATGIPKRCIRVYVLCGFDGSPERDWARCEWVESFKVMALPMWFHRLDALRCNTVTKEQEKLGWTEERRIALMQYYYQHRGRPFAAHKTKTGSKYKPEGDKR